MRISTSMIYQSGLSALQKANTEYSEAANRYTTGLKFTTAGEDPGGMATKIKYTASISQYDQYSESATLAMDSMAEEEDALDSMWTTLNSVYTRLIEAVDGTQDYNSLDAIAEDIDQAISSLYDLMNTRNSEGEYIFSGSDSSVPTMTKTADGTYVCQADGSTRSVQISPSVTIQVTDSGLNIFQNCTQAATISSSSNLTDSEGNATDVGYVMISDYDDYDDLFDDYYDYTDTTNSSTSNQIRFEITADPDGGASTYEVYIGDSADPVDSGTVDDDGKITYKGLEITLNDSTDSGTVTVQMERPTQDNVLNVLSDVVDALRNEDLSSKELSDILAAAQISVENAMDQYDKYRGRVGSRENEAEIVLSSVESLIEIKTQALADVSEVDAFEAASDISEWNNALEVARQVYNYTTGSSLFDYI